VPNVAELEMALHEAGLSALNGECKPAGMAQNVGMECSGESGLLPVLARRRVDGREVQGPPLLAEPTSAPGPCRVP
jgi:hypothetical protein